MNFEEEKETCDFNIDENILSDIGNEIGKTAEEIEEATNFLQESENASTMQGGQGFVDTFTIEQKVAAILWIYSMYKKGAKASKYIPAGICFLQKHLILSPAPIENSEKQEKQVASLYNKTENAVNKFVNKSTKFLKGRYGENPFKALLLILWELLLIYLKYLNAKQTKTIQKVYLEGITRNIIENHMLQPLQNLLVIICTFLYNNQNNGLQMQGGRGEKYKITAYSYKRAKKLGVKIKPSNNKKKKIDVYKGTRKIASIGAIGYKDYPTFMKINKTLAKERRRRYKTRHRKDRFKKGSPGYYADQILWSS